MVHKPFIPNMRPNINAFKKYKIMIICLDKKIVFLLKQDIHTFETKILKKNE